MRLSFVRRAAWCLLALLTLTLWLSQPAAAASPAEPPALRRGVNIVG